MQTMFRENATPSDVKVQLLQAGIIERGDIIASQVISGLIAAFTASVSLANGLLSPK